MSAAVKSQSAASIGADTQHRLACVEGPSVIGAGRIFCSDQQAQS
jgi:hypothetical protein